MLSAIFGRSSSETGADQGIYLLGWRTSPTVPLRLNEQDTTQTGVTLYVIRLAGS
jgi:hypothetical protein